MYTVKTISVSGFMDSNREIKIDLSPDANFIIGRNGTGKTTFINLINAALSADGQALLDLKFSKITFFFKKNKSRIVPQMTVEKSNDSDGFKQITYIFKNGSKANPEKMILLSEMRRRIVMINRQRKTDFSRDNYTEIKRNLDKLFKKTWLSLQRGADSFERDEFDYDEITYTSGVDKKISEVSNELTRYFSRLDKKVSDLTLSFQRGWLISFFATEKSVGTILRGDINIDEDKKAIEQIFSKFQFPRDSYASQLERHGKLAERVFKGFREKEKIEFKDFLIMYDVMKLHALVEQWQDLQDKQTEIYRPKYNLVEIASEMLFQKRLDVDSSNTIRVKSHKDEVISLINMSSGEKQLIIFLVETLLQEQETYIFLADEPELSLHIEWQEQLVPSLLRINPNAQVIFATHSPDVVGRFQNNIINMEELIG
jgi:predicted ATPase